MAYFPPELPMCAVCGTRVSQLLRRNHDPTGDIEYIAKCHGAVQIVRVDRRALFSMLAGRFVEPEFGLAFTEPELSGEPACGQSSQRKCLPPTAKSRL